MDAVEVSDVTMGVTRFSVSVDPLLLGEFDETTSDIGYSRSTAIQVAMRDFLTEHKWSTEEEGVVAGAVTMIYDHHVKGLGNTLTGIQHDFLDVISSTTHVHLDHDNCLEILAVKGDIKRIKELTQSLRVTRGVKQLKYSMLRI
jgi:CopG family nickel-responsive transcriptional regulator